MSPNPPPRSLTPESAPSTVSAAGLVAALFVAAALSGSTLGCGSPAQDTSPDIRSRSRARAPTDWEPNMDGLWMRAPDATPVDGETLERLGALGYAPGFEQSGRYSGVTVHDSGRARPGVNLYCSGHAPEAVLMDMDGTVLHTWRFAYDRVPDPVPDAHPWFSGSWRRVRLLDDGSLLAIFENLGLVKVDRRSELIWWFGGNAHHDLDLLDDGTILVLTREQRRNPNLQRAEPVIEDFVTVLSPDGVVERRISILDAVLRSGLTRDLARQTRSLRGDLFHTNTLEVLTDSLADHGPEFRPGNILLSLRHLDALLVLDPDSGEITWAATGPWRRQHEPTALDDGRILLFDNSGLGEASRVLEIEPIDRSIEWSYVGDPPESFYSIYCGAAARMDNGNTLITESCAGRAFEVTREGSVVWEFFSPHRAGERGELVAALFDVIRLPTKPAWLENEVD
jgi:hypothetical protein